VDADPVLDRIAALTREHAFVLVGIGGHGGAGKSTLAHLVADASVIGTDEFWDGAGFDLARLRAEVFVPLVHGGAATFASFDWVAGEPRGARTVEPAGVVVVEGVCALHRMFREDYHLRVWVEAPRDVRLARGVARDGEQARATWEEVWMPMEDAYVASDGPISAADLIVDGSS
jgi:uridine kinase